MKLNISTIILFKKQLPIAIAKVVWGILLYPFHMGSSFNSKNKERTARLCFVGRPLRSCGPRFPWVNFRYRHVAVIEKRWPLLFVGEKVFHGFLPEVGLYGMWIVISDRNVSSDQLTHQNFPWLTTAKLCHNYVSNIFDIYGPTNFEIFNQRMHRSGVLVGGEFSYPSSQGGSEGVSSEFVLFESLIRQE